MFNEMKATTDLDYWKSALVWLTSTICSRMMS
jgi:hypothetical protein